MSCRKTISANSRKEPSNFNALQLMGLAKYQLGQLGKAVDLFEMSLSFNPKFAAVRHNLAGTYRSLIDMNKAKENYRKAVKIKPDYGEAYQWLSEIIRFNPDDPLLELIEAQLSTSNLTAPEPVFFHFAAAKMYDDQGNYAKVFEHFFTGNLLKNENWVQTALDNLRQKLKSTFSKNYFPKHGINELKHSISSPIFIVGMPCSGSTLIEQILASHSCVQRVGELLDIPSIANQIGQFSSTSKNYPIDTSLSCYFQNFTNRVSRSFKLENIIQYYLHYRKPMDYWTEVLPVTIHNISYESLISKTEHTSQDLINFCGLEWEENCLQFYQNKRTVQTASVWQVRQPIYNRSEGR